MTVLEAAALLGAAKYSMPCLSYRHAKEEEIMSNGAASNEGPLQTVMRVELSDGTWVCVEASGPLNAITAEEVLEYWMVYQRVLKKRDEKSPADLLHMADQKVPTGEERKE